MTDAAERGNEIYFRENLPEPGICIYFVFQSAFMDSQSQADQSLETLQDIRRMMERSSRFISLSGLSGLSAGICALAGAWIGHGWIMDYYAAAGDLKWRL